MSAPSCPPNCGHTTEEHMAFDIGLRHGEGGLDECPYSHLPYVIAWNAGHSVGVMNREAVGAGETGRRGEGSIKSAVESSLVELHRSVARGEGIGAAASRINTDLVPQEASQ